LDIPAVFVDRCFISCPPSSKTKPVIMCLVRSRCGAVRPGCFTSSFITLIITIHPCNINTGCEIPSVRVSTTDHREVCLQEASLTCTTAFFFHLLLFRLFIVRYFYSTATSTTYVFVGSSQITIIIITIYKTYQDVSAPRFNPVSIFPFSYNLLLHLSRPPITNTNYYINIKRQILNNN